MKAIVLVGGFGTRLRPLTLSAPKQMLPLGRISMLERVIEKLESFGVQEAVLSMGYQPAAFYDEFVDGKCGGVQLHYAVEPEPLDTAGAIRFAADFAGINERVIALNGDVLSDIDLSELWTRHEAFGGAATIALTRVEDPSRFGVVPMDEESRVIEFIEKPDPGTAPSHWINAGMYILEPEAIDRIPEGKPTSIEREIFPGLAKEKCLYGVQSDAYWIDAGTPTAFLQAHVDLMDGVRGARETLICDRAVVSPDATVHRSAIGTGAVIGSHAIVSESVIMPGAHIEPNARIYRSIVGRDAIVGSGAILKELSIVGYHEKVPAGEESIGGLFPPREEW